MPIQQRAFSLAGKHVTPFIDEKDVSQQRQFVLRPLKSTIASSGRIWGLNTSHRVKHARLGHVRKRLVWKQMCALE